MSQGQNLESIPRAGQNPEGATEAEVRVMRDKVFGKPSTDKNWDACKENWMRADSIEWLQNTVRSMAPPWLPERGTWKAPNQ